MIPDSESQYIAKKRKYTHGVILSYLAGGQEDCEVLAELLNKPGYGSLPMAIALLTEEIRKLKMSKESHS